MIPREHSEPEPTEENVRLCTPCNEEQGGGIADLGDHSCSACGVHHAPHVYVPEERCLYTHERDMAYIREMEAELEAVKNERDLAVLTLAAFTPADKPNQGARG